MTTRRLNLFLVTFAGLAAGSACAAEGTATDPLRPLAECLDPTQARGWSIVDNDEIVVDAGRRKYHITFPASCPDLNFTTLLQFRTAGGSNRLCGYALEAVLPSEKGGVSIPCTIASISTIDKAEYKALTARKKNADKPTAQAPSNEKTPAI